MCLDPHARAKIEMREAVESLERVLLRLRSTNPRLSDAGLFKLAWLKRRLMWCDESDSRERSQKLLMWVAKILAEVLIRVMGASFCFQAAAQLPLSRYANNRKHDKDAPADRWTLASGVCCGSLDLAVLPLPDRAGQARGRAAITAPNGADARHACDGPFCSCAWQLPLRAGTWRGSAGHREAHRSRSSQSSSDPISNCLPTTSCVMA